MTTHTKDFTQQAHNSIGLFKIHKQGSQEVGQHPEATGWTLPLSH